MKTYQYIIGGVFFLLIGVSSCSREEVYTQEVKEGNVPIQLAGILPQAAGDCGEAGTQEYNNIYLSATVDNSGTPGKYFFQDKPFQDNLTLHPFVEGNTNANDIALQNPLYYPLEGKGLRLFAHTGKLDENKNLTLNAGKEGKYDYLISNGTDGEGTLSSSNSESTILTFRHIMTKFFVDIVTDSDPSDAPDPAPTSIEITLKKNLAASTGVYALTATENATNSTGNYTLHKGINYLVPNGSVLADHSSSTNSIYPIESLKIDDYTAEAADLATLALRPASGNTNEKVELKPGYAYKITFNIKRLKVTAITFKMIDWDTVVVGNENSSYVPAELKLNLGTYLQAEAKDTITKVVLHTDAGDNKQYVGDIIYKAGVPLGQFVSLPTAVESVDLYTSRGLLIAGVNPDSGTYGDDLTTVDNTTDKNITISLSKGGMRTLSYGTNSPTNPYLVETALQFVNISKETGNTVYYQQKNDIDLASLQAPFSPIGTFEGTYDGNGKRILYASFSGSGLFASNSGTIQNIRIASGKITATGTHAGSICGKNETGGKIMACINEAQLHGSASFVGGICGENNGEITACLNTGDLFTGSQYSAGICGENKNGDSGAITACVNVGMMNRSSSNMAGICGTTVSGTGILKTCYWLTGTAKKYSGNDYTVSDTEVAVSGEYMPANVDDVADLSPQKLRDGHNSEESTKTSDILSTACKSTDYKFTYAVKANGCVWPMPVKKISNP